VILCISHSQDYYTIDIVVKRMESLGKSVYRLNSDCFSDLIDFKYAIGNGSEQALLLKDQLQEISSQNIEAVWYRKLWDIKIPQDLEVQYAKPFLSTYHTMRQLFFEALQNKPWMNPMDVDHKIGGNKWLQLNLAKEAGLVIPESLFTNNAEYVKTFFYDVCNGKMIAKLHDALSRSMTANDLFFPTTAIEEKDLEDLEGLLYSPMIFQCNIEKQYELRIIYVDGIFFTGKINATQSIDGKTDWRNAKDLIAVWETYVLPERIEQQLTNMMKNMGLYFGAIDMIRQTDGQYIFLEVNPQGEWGMLQRDLAYPIGETIADKLVERIM
jgi:glutathione synthase/RimK-type ligase-like ATP-grasp enzyme